ncbi:MAG TPA: DUF6049 family protein [Nocardioidaceae bacterium]
MIRPAAARLRAHVPAGLRRLAAGGAGLALAAAALAVPPTAAAPPETPSSPDAAAAPPPAAATETPEVAPEPPDAEEGTAGDRPPLAVSIDTLTPSTVPRRGRITLTGEIRNRSRSTWTDLNVYLFTSASPMTTSAEVEEATATEATLEVGARVTGAGLYDEVDDLEPGQADSYRLSVPVDELPFSGPGVYWLGVHVLGTNEEGRVDGADGRARTFIPLMGERTPATTMALVLPLRSPVRRTAEGRLDEVAKWTRRLGDEGRLSRLVDLAGTAPDVPLTWVVDPAVLDAAGDLAEGNPSFDLAPTADAASPGASPTPEAPLTSTPGAEGEDLSDALDDLSDEAATAEGWLESFTQATAGDAVLALPYGDVDVATLLRGDFGGTLRNAEQLSTATMSDLGIDSTPVVAPLDGLLPPVALERLDPETRLVLSERAVDTAPGIVRVGGAHDVVVASDVARVGGPGPTRPYDALALRQRILAEAAVHGMTEGPDRPLVVTTPDAWNPGPDWRDADFFAGLDVPWVRRVDLPFAAAVGGAEEYDDDLVYRRADRRRELPVANVLATQDLFSSGSVLSALLTQNDTIDEQVGRAAMLGSSAHERKRPDAAAARTRQISADVHRRLSSVYVEGSPLVTMSSETGNFSVTVVNGLDEPVTVGIKVETGSDDLSIRPPDLVSLGPGQRASVRLAVSATDTGVHSVRFIPTTEDGRALGRATKIRVRSSQVGLVIWFVLGTGAVVFVAAIVTRILRRVRDRRRTHGPQLKDQSG